MTIPTANTPTPTPDRIATRAAADDVRSHGSRAVRVPRQLERGAARLDSNNGLIVILLWDFLGVIETTPPPRLQDLYHARPGVAFGLNFLGVMTPLVCRRSRALREDGLTLVFLHGTDGDGQLEAVL